MSMVTTVREKWKEPGYTKIPGPILPPGGDFSSVSTASFSYPAAAMGDATSSGYVTDIGNSLYGSTPSHPITTTLNGAGMGGSGSYIPNSDYTVSDKAGNMVDQRGSSAASYHNNAASADYTLPTTSRTQNEMTYCVIDGRLVDN